MSKDQCKLIDTHAHLGFKPLIDDIDVVIQRSIEAAVISWINVGTDKDENLKVIELSEKYQNLYSAIGYHPHIAKDIDKEDMVQLEELARNDKVVALGEMGLDFHYNFSKRQQQKDVFIKQLEIAKRINKPVIIHSREAFDETMEIINEYSQGIEKIVFHCFGGNSDQAKAIIGEGWYISFTGVVTFKNAHKVREAALVVPLDKIMLETDCPYMSPEPMRKQKVNEPALLVHTAKFLADLRGLNISEFAGITTENAKTFFRI